MPIRTADVIRTAALAVIDARASGIRTDAGEPIVDLVDSSAIESERGNVISEYLRRINSLPGWLSLISDEGFKAQLADAYGISYITTNNDFLRSLGVATTDVSSDVEALISFDLDNFAITFGRPRRAATQAVSTLRLVLSSSSAYNLSRGATVKRGSKSAIFYDTTSAINVATPSRDPTTGNFFVDVGIACRTPGRIGNAIRGSVNSTVGNLPGVISVSNTTPAQNGFDRESNANLLLALGFILSGTNVNTLFGLTNFVLAQSGVIDAHVVSPNDPLMTRSAAGAVDVFIIGSTMITDKAIATVLLGDGTEFFTLPSQPVQFISSVSDDLSNTFFFGGGFTVVPDEGSFSGSSKAHTQIQWTTAPPGPAGGRTVTVVYTFDGLVRDIQRRLDTDPKINIPDSAILIREATLVGVTGEMQVVPIAGIELLGHTQDDVNAAAEAATSDYFEALKLGQEGDYSSALVKAAEAEIGGVRVVDHINDFSIAETGNVPGTNNLKVAPNEYLRLDTLTFLT